MTPGRREQLALQLSKAAAVVKLACGVGNNAAWLVTLDALDQVRRHRSWRRGVKGGGSVGGEYKRVVKAFHQYERNLVYTDTNRFFHMDDMTPQVRKYFGDRLTDREYYDYWTSVGGEAYTKTRPLVTSLCNKYRLSLQGHGVAQPDVMAWAMTATACLSVAVKLHELTIDECATGFQLPRRLLERVFKGFSLATVLKLWTAAMEDTDPTAFAYELDTTEARNIDLGLRDLMQSWISLRTLYDSAAASTEEYDEVFRTKGEQRKALRQIAECRAASERGLMADGKGGRP